MNSTGNIPAGFRVRFAAALLLGLGAAAHAQRVAPAPGQQAIHRSPPSGPLLLAAVRTSLPTHPIAIDARLTARRRNGDIEKILYAGVDLHWGAAPPRATYTIRDRFGEDRERLRITWRDVGQIERAYARGRPLEPAEAPPWFAPIAETDLTWADLSLSFLWWKDAETVGTEEKRGRLCYIVDTRPPAPVEGIARVRLWIDAEIKMILEAQTLDPAGDTTRKLRVKSFKKMDEVWMLKDMDVYHYPSYERTTLEVLDLTLDPRPPSE